MIITENAVKDTYVTDLSTQFNKGVDANFGQASTLDLFKIVGENKNVKSRSLFTILDATSDLVDDKTFTYPAAVVTGSDQVGAFNTLAQHLLRQTEQGYSCTLIAYGQTGSGKTYTFKQLLNAVDFPQITFGSVLFITYRQSLAHSLYKEMEG